MELEVEKEMSPILDIILYFLSTQELGREKRLFWYLFSR